MNTLLQVNFRSQVLLLHDAMNVILPDDRVEGDFPVLWLLHGGGGNENDWLHNTRIRAYANKHNIAVVMPHAGYSRYCNMYWGAGTDTDIIKASAYALLSAYNNINREG